MHIVLSAKEISFLSTKLQDDNTFEHSNEDYLLSLEQGWNHEAQLDFFTANNDESRYGWRVSFI